LSKRILIVRTDRVGDVVMITPMVREIKKAYPDSFIATLTQPNTTAVLQNNPYIDLMITDDLKEESYKKVIAEISKHKFTDGLLVLPTERAAYQMFRAGVKNRIGVGRKLYEIVTFMKSVSRNNYIPLRHEADYCMDLARKIGVVTENFQPEIFVTEEEKEWAGKFYEECCIDENIFKIILHTGSKNSAPNWRAGKYLELLKGILKKFPSEKYAIMLTAMEMTDGFKKDVKNLNDDRIIDVSHKITNLRELIKVISGIDLMLCSSTGPIHLADALDIKCIGIHCHRNVSCAKHWGVINKKSVNLEVTKQYCDSHCSNDRNICNFEDGITTEEVINHIEIKK
jgi:ADP-heptose:LPS heptosyltransferase